MVHKYSDDIILLKYGTTGNIVYWDVPNRNRTHVILGSNDLAAFSEMADHHDLPFKAEYAKSSRASCKACRTGIQQDTLRLGIMVQVGNKTIETLVYNATHTSWLLFTLPP